MKENRIIFKPEKLKALVHYVCDRAPNPRQLGATKLNKVLYFSDTQAYLILGEPITGETYVKHQYGPVSSHLQDVVRELEDERALAVADASGFNVYEGVPYTQRMFYSLRKPNLSLFRPEEVSIVDQVLEVVSEYTAREISEASHDVVWHAAEIGEELPYSTSFARTLGEITPDDIAWAQKSLAHRGM